MEFYKKWMLGILIICSSTSLLSGQNDYYQTDNARESLQHAQHFINNNDLKRALKQLKHTIRIKEDFAVAYRELGKVNLELENFGESVDAYEASFDLDGKISRAAYFECGEAYFMSNDVHKALYYYDEYEKRQDTKYTNKEKESGLEVTYDMLLPERKENCLYVLKSENTPIEGVELKNLGGRINSEQDEYLPTITSNGNQMVFTQDYKHRDENIMISEKGASGKWLKRRKIGAYINTSHNEGMAKYATHGKTFYYAGCERHDTEGGCDIYEAQMDGDEVVVINRLEGLNSEYWDSQPSISCDGKTMYFSSTRHGGYGGADIWISQQDKDGDWLPAKNLGPYINTPKDEEAAYIATDGKTLYFTSNGYPGQGDGDLFITRKTETGWTEPQNMGYPINSQCKEMGFYVQGDGKTAYISSARFGGEGGLDIYELTLPNVFRPKPMVHVEGFVTDANTGEPISTKVSVSRLGKKWEVTSDKEGWFFLCFDGNKGYSFQSQHEGYEYFMSAVFLEQNINEEPTRVLIKLIPEKAAPPPPPKPEPTKFVNKVTERRIRFYFAFDSYDVDENTKVQLDNLADMLKREKHWQVEIIGYADKKGDIEYNKKLSQQRANAIVNYLQERGVTIHQVIKQEGVGAVSNSSKDKENRRVEVVLKRS